MATQPSANPKNLFAFLLGMLTLTQGLILPTESLLQRRAAKVQKRNQFPTANGYLRDHCRKLGATRKFSSSLTRPSRQQTPMSFKRAARSDLDAPISPLLSPVSRPCSLGCEVRYPSPTSYCGAQLEHSSDTEIVARKRAQRPTVSAGAKIPIVPVEFSPPLNVVNRSPLHTEEVPKFVKGERRARTERTATARNEKDAFLHRLRKLDD